MCCPIWLDPDVGDSYAMLLRNCESNENLYGEGHALLTVVNKILHYFLQVSSDVDKIPYRSCPQTFIE